MDKDLILRFPTVILSEEKLNPTERFLLAVIIAFDNDKGCFASNEKLAEYLNCSPGKVSGAISKLKELGYIISSKQTEGRGGRNYTRTVREDLKIGKAGYLNKNSSLKTNVRQPPKIRKQINNTSNNEGELNRVIDIVLHTNVKDIYLKYFNGDWLNEHDIILKKLILSALNVVNNRFPKLKENINQRDILVTEIFQEIFKKPPPYFEDTTLDTYSHFWEKVLNQKSISKIFEKSQHRYGDGKDKDECF